MGLRLLHYSDVENAYDDPERIGRLAGLLRSLDGDDALVCGTGDNTSPGVLALRTRGAQSLQFFEAVGADVETLGNHDFDYGPERTLELVGRSPQQWVCANAYVDGERFGAGAGIRPWVVAEAAGERVGVFGVVDPRTPSINPNATGIEFTDPVEAARDAVDALRDASADHVVALSHLGLGDEELAAAVDIDAVLGGHVHSERVERAHGAVLTRPGVNGRVVLEVSLPDGAVTRHEVADAPLAADVADALREEKAAAGVDEVVARASTPVERSQAAAFRGESRVGNFVADAYRWAALRADAADGLPPERVVGLQNSGGIRSGPPLAGEVTVGDLISVVPFEEPVAVLELSGERLLAAFAEGHGGRLDFGEPDWWHAHVSAGVALTYDHATDALEVARVGGEPVDPDATYRVATTDYLLHTTDEFPSLRPRHRVTTLDTQYEVLADYACAVGVDPAVEGRIAHTGR